MSDGAHAQTTWCDRLADLSGADQARMVEFRSPGWLCWYGRATGEFWATPELPYPWWGLVWAATAEAVAARIVEVDAFYGRAT